MAHSERWLAGFAESAPGIDIGRQEYHANCVACHGTDGGGRGPYAELLQVPVEKRDTFNTQLQNNFDRIFTSAQVTETEVIENIMTVTRSI